MNNSEDEKEGSLTSSSHSTATSPSAKRTRLKKQSGGDTLPIPQQQNVGIRTRHSQRNAAIMKNKMMAEGGVTTLDTSNEATTTSSLINEDNTSVSVPAITIATTSSTISSSLCQM